MSRLKDEVVEKAKFKPLVIFRFIDKYFSFRTIQNLTGFINLFHNRDKSIKIDNNIDEISIDVLDVKSFKGC